MTASLESHHFFAVIRSSDCFREIGRGGMGVVYEAWQGTMNRQVALKVLPVGVAVDTKAVARFVREAQVAGNLQHPNVVAVYGVGVDERTPYYSMEYVEGETLAQILRRLASSGCAIAITGHEVRSLFDTADDVLWMTAGTTHALGTPAEAKEHHQFVREYLGVGKLQ